MYYRDGSRNPAAQAMVHTSLLPAVRSSARPWNKAREKPLCLSPRATESRDRLTEHVARESTWPGGPATPWPIRHLPIPADRVALPGTPRTPEPGSPESPAAAPPPIQLPAASPPVPTPSATLPCVARPVRCEFPVP